jgi:hypothetical protein
VKRCRLIKTIESWRRKSTNVSFDRLCAVAEALGFRFDRIYVLEGVKEILNIQNVNGEAKSYQVEQFIDLVDKYKLLGGEDDV